MKYDKTKFEIGGTWLKKYIGMESTCIVPDGITHISKDAFAYNRIVTEIKLPESVIWIDHHAFSSCENLRKIYIPDSVTEIGNGGREI